MASHVSSTGSISECCISAAVAQSTRGRQRRLEGRAYSGGWRLAALQISCSCAAAAEGVALGSNECMCQPPRGLDHQAAALPLSRSPPLIRPPCARLCRPKTDRPSPCPTCPATPIHHGAGAGISFRSQASWSTRPGAQAWPAGPAHRAVHPHRTSAGAARPVRRGSRRGAQRGSAARRRARAHRPTAAALSCAGCALPPGAARCARPLQRTGSAAVSLSLAPKAHFRRHSTWRGCAACKAIVRRRALCFEERHAGRACVHRSPYFPPSLPCRAAQVDLTSGDLVAVAALMAGGARIVKLSLPGAHRDLHRELSLWDYIYGGYENLPAQLQRLDLGCCGLPAQLPTALTRLTQLRRLLLDGSRAAAGGSIAAGTASRGSWRSLIWADAACASCLRSWPA